MQSTCGIRARIVLCFLIVVSASLCTAKDGRDFAGFYSVDQANQQDGLVQLKFSLRVYNYSANDIKQAYVALREPGPGLSVRANFHPVKSWRMQRDVKLSAQVVITEQEYQGWQNGEPPNIVVRYPDANGRWWEHTVELSMRPPGGF
jgi:hypothetical protein